VSSGCVRLTNEDVTDLYSRIGLGTKVVVLPETSRHLRGEDVARTDDRRDDAAWPPTVSPQGISPQATSAQVLPQVRSSRRIFTEPGPAASAFTLY
jgi:L,D-transpeptidase catalytic domain